jgi:cobalt-zinc-cadmium efflux system protein
MCDPGLVSAQHVHGVGPDRDRRWLLGAFALVVAFMVAEIVAGLAARSLALLADAGHMVTDAAALLVAVIAARIARRPARGAFTYGFARVDALSGQANGITLLLLAAWFTVQAILRLIRPAAADGGVITAVALVGALVNIAATSLASRADRRSLNVRGVLAHLITDIWAFAATFVAGIVIMITSWHRADPAASLLVAALMAWTGWRLVRAAGRVFLEAAPQGTDPQRLGDELAAVDGVAEVHDLHLWQIGTGEPALSAHVLVRPAYDCHAVSGRLRTVLSAHGISHVTLQADHADSEDSHADGCADVHGQVHIAP